MAALLDLSRQAYGDIERDNVNVSIDRLEKIAEVLGVTVTDLLSLGDKVSNFFDQCSNPNVIANNLNP